MATPGGLVDKQELIDAQLDTAHLGRVVNSKDASGAPISTSTNRTGGVNKTLDALESSYTPTVINLPTGQWAPGVIFNARNEIMYFNGIAYKLDPETEVPYTTQGSDPTVLPDMGNVIPVPQSEVGSSDYVATSTANMIAGIAGTSDNPVPINKANGQFWKVQGEGDMFSNYLFVEFASDIDLGDGLWAKKLDVNSDKLILESQRNDSQDILIQQNADKNISQDSEIAANTAKNNEQDSRLDIAETNISALQSGQGSSVIGYATQAQLFADLNHDDGSIGYVTNDSTAINNGTYRKIGAPGSGSWVQSSNDIASQAYQQSSRNTEIIDESGLSFEDISGYDFAVVDQNNKASFAVLSDGSFFDYSKLPEVRHSVIIGQSLAHGFNSSPAITTTDDLGNLTFNNDPRSTTFSLLTPLIEIDSAQEGESPASGVASQIKRGKIGQFYNDAESEFPFTSIATTHAQNAATISQISQGTQSYDNAQEAILRAYMLSSNYDLSGIFFIQGEGDELARTDRTVYKNALIQLKNDHISDMRSAIGRPNQKVPFITYQTNDRYSFTTPIAALAQLDAANEDLGVFMATPIYFLTVSDDRHLTNHSSRWMGEMLGKVYNRIINGENWSPIQPLQISGSGTSEITVKFHVPNPPLIFDGNMVVDPGSYGFEVVDDSGSVSISQVEIIDAYIVKITLASTLTTNPRLRYAYTSPSGGPAGRLTGARGNLRDSDNTISNYTDAGGNPYKLYNWCVTFDEEIS